MDIRKISVIIILTALSIATNYALIGIPQIKLMDFIVFIGGFCFGPLTGVAIGVSSWLIYGVLNPYGFVPQIWLATMLSEALYGLIGGFLGRKLNPMKFNGSRYRLIILFGSVGFIATLLYDLVTNVVYASVFDVPLFLAIAIGAPFTILHQLGNALIFGLGAIPVIEALNKSLRGGWIVIPKE